MSLCSLEDLLISIKRCDKLVSVLRFLSQGDRHQQSLTSSFWRLPVGWRCTGYACIQPRTGRGRKSTWLLPTQAFWCFRLEPLGRDFVLHKAERFLAAVRIQELIHVYKYSVGKMQELPKFFLRMILNLLWLHSVLH